MPDATLAMVTGASGGIGTCIARRLADRGYHLILVGRNRDHLEEVSDEVGERPHRILEADLADPASLAPAIREGLGRRRVEVLVNNAGFGVYSPFLDQGPGEHRQLFEVNYFAAAEMIRLVLPGMIAARRGWVINVSSLSSKVGPWGHSGYAGAKAALASLTQSLAAEYDLPGLHFCYVNPGIVDTAYFRRPGMMPLWEQVRRYAVDPDRVGKAVESLLDRPKLEICVPRHHRLIDLLIALSPKLAHRVVSRHSRPRGRPAEKTEESTSPAATDG
ncbi:MAG: SDR family NAD(P)-dependent oxidoreductase [Phycisphaeraceae bacterium]